MRHILLVDDDPKNLQVLANILDREDYHIEYAMHGLAALEWIEETRFDLILLDVMMPNMDGFEVCRQIRSNKNYEHIPVIFITANTDNESVLKGFEAGGQDYITKPFNSKELLARVNTQIALKHSREIVTSYAEEIEVKNKEITESIRYASLIQNAILPTDRYLSGILNDYFIFYRPKEIVSGDFYWIRKIGDKIIIIGADCTGHGVPGAFMSMFGIAFLNEIVVRDKITAPNIILNHLREKVISSFGQYSEPELKDGMDMAVISIDINNNKLEFAGARHPLYLVRNRQLLEYKSDMMSVSVGMKMDDFTNHTIKTGKNDKIYFFSDGYVDQFGGPNRKKYRYKAFRRLIAESSGLPMKEQKKMIIEEFDEWKGNFYQIDDVFVMGIKI